MSEKKGQTVKTARGKIFQKPPVISAAVLIFTVLLSMAATMYGERCIKNIYLEKQYKILSDDVYELTNNVLNKPITASLTMSNDYFVKAFLRDEDKYSEDEAIKLMSDYLTSMKKTMNARTSYLISENSKRYYSYGGLNKIIDVQNDPHDKWYSIFANSRKPYDLDVDVDQVNNNAWTVFINARIEDENHKMLGVCGIGCSMDEFQDLLTEVEQSYDVKVNFINSDGLVQVDTDAVNIDVSYIYDVQYGKEKDGYSYKNSDGEYVIMRYVSELNWYMVLHGKSVSIGGKEIVPVIINGLCVMVINIAVMIILNKNKNGSGAD